MTRRVSWLVVIVETRYGWPGAAGMRQRCKRAFVFTSRKAFEAWDMAAAVGQGTHRVTDVVDGDPRSIYPDVARADDWDLAQEAVFFQPEGNES